MIRMKNEMIGQPQLIATGPPLFQAWPKVVKHAGQDGDDGERDGEVGEPAPLAPQLLSVAELGQPLLVRVVRLCHLGWRFGCHV